MSVPEFEDWLRRSSELERQRAQAWREQQWPRSTRVYRLVNGKLVLETSPMEEFYTHAQDRQAGRAMLRSISETRHAEEVTIYGEDGTMLGTMTFSIPFVTPSKLAPRWLTPVYERIDMTREDLVRRYGRHDA